MVHGIDTQHAGLAVGGGVELADEPVGVADRERELPPAALRRRLVHLELGVELEEFGAALGSWIRRQQRRPTCARLAKKRRLDAPLPLHAVDDSRSPLCERQRTARPVRRRRLSADHR